MSCHANPQMKVPPLHKPLIISGLTFDAPLRYAEGHQLSANEASALNALFHSDLAAAIRRLVAKEEKESPGGLQPATIERLQAQFREAIERHNFAPKGPANSFDPIQQIALTIAMPQVKSALVKKGQDVSAYTKEQLEDLALRAIEKFPHFREEAKTRLSAMRETAAQVYGE